MREIKFRGRDISTGEYCYGYFRQHETEIYPRAVIYCADDRFRIVEPDSVAQLVGYDANGNEVYEGDTVIWNDLPMTAKFITNISGGEVLKEGDQ